MMVYNFDGLSSCSFGVKNYFSQINSYLRLTPSRSFKGNFKGLLTTSSRENVLWTPGQGGSLIHPLQVITCHDVIDFSLYKPSYFRNVKKAIHERLYKNARHIVFISDCSLQDFTKTFPSVLTDRSVIRSPTIIEPTQSTNASPIGLDDFILVVTNNLEHKNNVDIFDLAATLQSKQVDFPVVVVGNIVVPKHFEYLLGKSLFVLNNIPSRELLGLQTHANVVISTSLAEGHNLPIAEGLGLGAPVIATAIPAHEEYYKDLIKFYVAGEINELFSKCMEYYPKKPLMRKILPSGQSWEMVASEYSTLFNKIC
jgi:glycosyltransferase involved in cell wall biosynthesis